MVVRHQRVDLVWAPSNLNRRCDRIKKMNFIDPDMKCHVSAPVIREADELDKHNDFEDG